MSLYPVTVESFIKRERGGPASAGLGVTYQFPFAGRIIAATWRGDLVCAKIESVGLGALSSATEMVAVEWCGPAARWCQLQLKSNAEGRRYEKTFISEKNPGLGAGAQVESCRRFKSPLRQSVAGSMTHVTSFREPQLEHCRLELNRKMA